MRPIGTTLFRNNSIFKGSEHDVFKVIKVYFFGSDLSLKAVFSDLMCVHNIQIVLVFSHITSLFLYIIL